MFLSNTTFQIKSCTSDINFSTQKSMRGAKSKYRDAVHSICNLRHKILSCSFWQWVRLNYATTHHHSLPPTTIHQRPSPPTTSQNISITTHHHPPPAKIYSPLPTTTQKMDHNQAKAKIYSYITSFWQLLFLRNTIFLYVTEILCAKVLISLFFKFKVSTTFYDFQIYILGV